MLNEKCSLHELVLQLNCNHDKKTLPANSVVSLADSDGLVCVIILSGTVSVYRRNPEMLLAVGDGPLAFGFSFLFPENVSKFDESLYILTTSDIEYVTMSPQKLRYTVTMNGLWEVVAGCLNYTLVNNTNNLQRLLGQRSEELVKQVIHLYIKHPTTFKDNTILADYIQQRTLLSRATIMDILKRLKKSQDICMHRGRLLKVNF